MNITTNQTISFDKKEKKARGLHLFFLFVICFWGQVSFAQFPAPYCDVDAIMVEEITKIQFAGLTIVNTNDEDLLLNHTARVANVTPGQSYTIQVEGNTYGDFNELIAFIDWNQNGVLNDAGEVFYLGELDGSDGSDGQHVSFSIPIPATALAGQTRIRVTKTWTDPEYDVALIEDPCSISIYDYYFEETGLSYGQAIDFTLNIGDGTTPPETSEGCEIGITLTFPEYGDVTTWSLLDADGVVVLSGGPYEEGEDFSITASYYGTNHPYALEIEIDDSFLGFCDNEVQYAITIGDVEDQSGTVSACEEVVTENIVLGSCPPGCLKPSMLSKTNITPTGFTLTWMSGGNQFEIEYGPEGFVQGSTEGTVISAVETTSYTFSDLDHDTAYEFYVRRICSEEEGDQSPWAGPLTFDEILTTRSPWHENFQASETYPLGWGAINNSPWFFEEYDTDHQRSMGVYLYDFSIFGNYLKAEFKTITVGPIRTGDVFSFNYLMLDGLENPAFDELGKMDVQLSTDFGTSYSTIGSILSNGEAGWQNFSFELDEYVGLYVTIKITAKIQEVFEDLFVLVDDFDISSAFTCMEIEEAEIEGGGSVEIQLNITSEATEFVVEYGPAGFELGEGTTVNNVGSSYEFTDLEEDTEYEVYVHALPCGDWYGPVAFSTQPLRSQVITAADVTKTYGDLPFEHGTSDSELALTYVVADETVAKFEHNTFVIKGVGTTTVTASQAGNHQFLPAEDVTFTLTVTKAMLTVTADSTLSKQFNEVDPIFTYTVGGLQYADTPDVITGLLSREVGEELGTYAITLGTLQAEPNYDITYISADFTINAKELIVRANASQKVYGEIDSALTYQVIGLEGGVDAATVVTGTPSREAGENVGRYTIGVGTVQLVDEHYVMVFEENQFTITPAVLSLYPVAGVQKVYGQADPAVFEFTVTGFKFDDTRESVLQGLLGRAIGENVGEYLYQAGTLTTTQGNYSFVMGNQEKFKITAAPIAVVVHANQSKRFGQADPVFTYTLEGLRLGDYPSNVMVGNLEREPGEDLGLYTIHQGSLTSRQNYYITSFIGADFEILQGQISGVTLPSQTFVYDGEVKSLTLVGVTDPEAIITYVNNDQVDVGVYQVTATVDYGPAYQPLSVVGTLTITKADQVISFGNVSTVVIEDTPTLQLYAISNVGLPISYRIDNAADLEVATVEEDGLMRFLKPGDVTVTASQDGNANYNAAIPVSRTIEVTSRAVEIENLLIDGISYGTPEQEIFVELSCDTQQDQVIIEVQVAEGMQVSPSKYIVVPVKEYGSYTQEITVTSSRGIEHKTYTVHLVKRIGTESLIYQKYTNLLLVNNNKNTNGGYVFTAYEWFKNGESIGKKQAYSAGENSSDALEAGAAYHVVLTLHSGKQMVSCPIYIENKTEANWGVYPNPVQKNQRLFVRLDDDQQQAVSYSMYDLKGQVIQTGDFVEGTAEKGIQVPATVAAGSYFLVLKGNGKQKSVQFIVKE
ncbi:MBG domain-containing protein [Myroides sp. DF42-4-2]|uniref:MBG domain-containing protein n=1 Tax=unclassified Myroides TaxID=2642485 RepID=UPI0025749F21|nr:MBG domain-containing protein [Myroides sp. DF42-4-2]MDM1406504.1 T9SS type A sorting domain-containing protein [Myroides sp. DF42-4-2]